MVYQAHDPHLGRLVALKVVRSDKAANEEVLQQLLAEAGVTASVNHPNVVRVYSVGNAGGRFFIAMELVGGGSLDDLMEKSGPLPEARVLDIAIQIASGLQAATQVGLVHRDIKPGNILFADPQTPKLADFGLAIFEQHSAAGEVWGTPYYMPPERLRGEPEDLRGDIYALGATLFHALAGRPPFEAKDSSQVALKRLHSPAPSVLTFAPKVSNATAFVIKKMLEGDPNARFANYEELIESLQFARNELGTKPAAKSRVVVDTEQGSKSGMWIAVAGIGVLAVAGIGYMIFGGSKEKTVEVVDPLTAPASPDAPATSAPTEAPKKAQRAEVPLGEYVLINRKNGHLLDIANSKTESGAEVCAYARRGTPMNERWIIKPSRDGSCRIFSSLSFKCLDVRSGSSDDNAAITAWNSNTGLAQKWRFRQAEEGWYILYSEGSGKALTMLGERPENGGESVGQRAYNATQEQQWRVEKVNDLTDNYDLIDPVVTPTLMDPPTVKVRTLTGTASPRFVQLDLAPMATADSRKGLFRDQNPSESVQAMMRGQVDVAGVPFTIGDPARAPKGMDIIVLKGGMGYSKSAYPQKVEIPVGGVPLSKVHVVGGIAGWGYPWTAPNETEKHLGLPLVKMTIVFQGAETQEILLRNGYEICDHLDKGQMAAGSAKIEGFANEKNQLRYFSKPVTDPRPVDKIILESFNNQAAPTFFALTGEKR